MPLLHRIADLLSHIDQYMVGWFADYGLWAYLFIFLIILCENGVIFAVFLPGDSLVFGAGVLAASGRLHAGWLFAVLVAAALCGYTLNYLTGHYFGRKWLGNKGKLIKPEYMQKTRGFFKLHGGKTVLLARFVPFVRTFASFVAGMGEMTFGRFSLYNLAGSVLWVCALFGAGYFTGDLTYLRGHWRWWGVLVAIALFGMWLMHRLAQSRAEKR